MANKSTTELIAEIHNEFNSASDRILMEAQKILSTVNYEKAKRLANVGFENAREAKELNFVNSETAQLIERYQIKYPNNKFIDFETALAICKKYNLVMADVKRYTGFVPEKNLREIENFSCNYTDESIITVAVKYQNSKFLLIPPFAQSKINRELRKKVYFSFESDWAAKSIIHRKFQEETGCQVYESLGAEYAIIEGLQICAPKSDMNLNGLSNVSGKIFGSKHVPDPVVLQPVKGGFLIVTAWGDEASDELVVNEKMN